MDHYEVLEVPRDVDLETLKKQYRKLAKKYNTDQNGGSDEKMAAINVAYEVLSDAVRRANYDATGVDRPSDIDNKAKQLLCAKVLDFIHSNEDISFVFTRVYDVLRQELRQMECKYAEGEKLIAKYRRALDRIKYKGAGENLLEGALMARITDVENKMKQVLENQELIKHASELVAEYECAPLEDALRSLPFLGSGQIDPIHVLRQLGY